MRAEGGRLKAEGGRMMVMVMLMLMKRDDRCWMIVWICLCFGRWCFACTSCAIPYHLCSGAWRVILGPGYCLRGLKRVYLHSFPLLRSHLHLIAIHPYKKPLRTLTVVARAGLVRVASS